MIFNKYDLYERSVQSAKTHVDWFVSIYKDLHKKYPKRLREDFCGTFQVSCEWVKRNRNNTAVGLDLDPEPLSYGKKKNFAKLSLDQKRRLKVIKANVLDPTQEKHDLIYAGNFSFFIFQKRAELLHYFQSCLKSLKPNGGSLLLELAGGPGMITSIKETKSVQIGRTKNKNKKFVYIWDQKDFDPIRNQAQYAIHFKLPSGKTMRNAFEYDWRLWSIAETRDVLADAGFTRSYVYWETEHRGRGTGEFIQAEYADNAYSWIGYIVAVR